MKDCPAGIDIPGVLGAVNMMMLYNNPTGAQGHFNWVTRSGAVASTCIQCSQCEGVCPQHIDIIAQLERAASMFEKV